MKHISMSDTERSVYLRLYFIMQARFAPFAPPQGADQCVSSQRVDKGEHFPPDRDKITAHYRLHSARRKENLLHIDTANQHWLSAAGAGGLDWGDCGGTWIPTSDLNGTH